MTGVTYIQNDNGDTTHVVLDWSKYGQTLKNLFYELEDIQIIQETEGEEEYSLEEAIELLAKQGKVSKEDLLKMANVQDKI